MKIAVFHELPSGGARRAVNEIALRLKKNNVVDLYLVDEEKNLAEKKYFNNIYFYKFKPKIWHGKNWKIRLYKDSIELIQLHNLHKRISKDIENKQYDLLFVHASKYTEAPFILRFSSVYKIFYCHDPHYRMIYESILDIPEGLDPVRYMYERLNRYIRKKIDRKNIDKTNLLIANSIYTKKETLKTYGKMSKVCYLGVDEELFKPKKSKKMFDVLFIGSYQEIDGYPLLMESIKLMKTKPKIKILVIEDQWISDDQKLRDLYLKSKVTVCLAANEPFGLIPLEAMSCGTPVLAVNEGGYKESIKNGKTGILVSRNSRLISKKLEWLLNSPKTLNSMSNSCRKHILDRWTWDISVRNIERIFKESINN